MSVNCIKCGVNKRTGPDLLCDGCRAKPHHISGCAYDSNRPDQSTGSCMPECPIGGEETRKRLAQRLPDAELIDEGNRRGTMAGLRSCWDELVRRRKLVELREDRVTTPTNAILEEFRQARLAGQQKYGGDDSESHDLNNRLSDWLRFVRDHLDRAGGPDAFVSLDQREHLVKAGGLILSAIWAEDVKAGRIAILDCNKQEAVGG